MGAWVYSDRQREPKMEIPGKISLSAPLSSRRDRATAPVAELTSQKLPDTSTRTLAEAERAHIMATLRETNWVVGGRNRAAARLGVKGQRSSPKCES
jgi:transcriptional regulator with GAF, ATPase, and Fis domain